MYKHKPTIPNVEMNKVSKNSSSKGHSHKDDADVFREQSLRAIRRRKNMSKYGFWILTAVAVLVVAAVFAAYYLDR